MKNIIKIFFNDIRGLGSSVFLIIICIGLSVLPALYAWFNIYSNWDPYGNTQGINMGVVSEDKGYYLEDGSYENMGSTILENLSENDSIGWEFPETTEAAVDAVYAGEYYGVLVIDENFTANIYSVLDGTIKNPVITYYENEKKNGVATKITDTAVETLKTTINEEFIKTVSEKMLKQANAVLTDVENVNIVNLIENRLRDISRDLEKYDNVLNDFTEKSGNLSNKVLETKNKLPNIITKIDDSSNMIGILNGKLGDLEESLKDADKEATTVFEKINADFNELDKIIKQILAEGREEKIKELIQLALNVTQRLSERINNVENALTDLISLTGDSSGILTKLLDRMEKMNSKVNSIHEILSKVSIDKVKDSMNKIQEVLDTVSDIYTEDVVPWVNETIGNVYNTLDNTDSLLINAKSIFENAEGVFDGAAGTISGMSTSIVQLKEIVHNLKERVDSSLDKLENAAENEKIGIILNLLNGDYESYGEFFADPVEVVNHKMYPVDYYGSSMAPFYTTLALWVGALILIALFNVKPKQTNLINPKPYQLYFGRFLVFALIGQIQALIIICGDLYLLHVQCLHPVLLFAAASAISLTFNLIVYSLTLAFADVGKALAVVIMVIQIAGSGGTFPIELLPQTFQNIYRFFPFPYAINAIRETIAGMYNIDYVKYLIQLSAFSVAAMIIGLIIRKPFAGIIEFMEKRMKDTKMM